jgi:DUF1016 N-terminal domain
LFVEIAALINTSKENVLHNVNKELTLLNWHIGKQLYENFANLDEHYGLEIVATVSQLLMQQYGKGYTKSALSRIQQFYKLFPKIKIVATLSQLLSWSHFIELTNVKDNLARSYYLHYYKSRDTRQRYKLR